MKKVMSNRNPESKSPLIAPDVDLSAHFGILPEISGKFEASGYTSVFIPDEPLAQNSIYRVTLRAGLRAPNGMTLKEDYTFSFETSNAPG